MSNVYELVMELDKLDKAGREAVFMKPIIAKLVEEVTTYFEVITVARDDLEGWIDMKTPDISRLSDGVMQDIAAKMSNTDAFMDQYWMSLRYAAEDVLGVDSLDEPDEDDERE